MGNTASSKAISIIAAVVVLAAGFGLFGYLLFTGISGVGSDLISVKAPGESVLDLKEPGKYTVFVERGGLVDGAVQSGPVSVSGLRVLVRNQDGQEIPVGPAGANQTYSVGSRQGYSILEFTVDQPGKYVLNASFDRETKSPPFTLTLSRGFMGNLFKVIALSMAALLGGILVATVIIVLAFVNKHADKRQQTPGMPPPIG